MLCPNCRMSCATEALFCQSCGADLSIPSKSLVSVQTHVPSVLHNPQLPRLAVGVGALAVGVGLELLRRGLLMRLTRSARSSPLPVVSPQTIRELFSTPENQVTRLPKGYEIRETLVYMSRVIRRED